MFPDELKDRRAVKNTGMNRIINYAKILIPIAIIISIFLTEGCGLSFGNLYDHTPPDDDEEDVLFNEPSLYYKNIFVEKRKTRKIGFKKENDAYNLNDFDRDGINNTDDPYPLDYSYPGVIYGALSLPLITGNPSYTYTLKSITGNTTPSVGTFSFVPDNFPDNFNVDDITAFINDSYTYNKNGIIDVGVSRNMRLKLNIVSVNNQFSDGSFDRDYIQYFNTSPVSPKTISVSGRLLELGSKYSTYQYDYITLGKEIYSILTNTPIENVRQDDILNFCEYGTDSNINYDPYLLLPSSVCENLDLPNFMDDDKWNALSYDTILFSTLYTDRLVDIRLTGLKNKICYSPYLKDFTHDGFEIKFNSDQFNYNDGYAIKVLIEKEGTTGNPLYYVRVFLSGNRLAQWSEGNEYIRFLDFPQSGFSFSSIDWHIKYDFTNDLSNFRNYLYQYIGDEADNKYKGSYEYYILFFFLFPHFDYPDLWSLLGCNVHFWSPPDRTTIIAKLNSNNEIIQGPYVVPFEYLVHPDRFIYDNYINFNNYESFDGLTYAQYEDGIFDIDANLGEKVLFVQGCKGLDASKQPAIDVNNTCIVLRDIKGEDIKQKISSITKISQLSALPGTHEVVNRFITDFKANAYIISFDELYLINRSCFLQADQLNYYADLKNNIELKSLKAKSITGLTCTLEFQDDIYNNDDHWIPNTDEMCRPFKVKTTGTDVNLNPVSIPGYFDFKILSPHDPNWGTNDADNSNINRNKGTCQYMLYASTQQGTGELRLLTFEMNPSPVSIDDGYRIVEYNPQYFESTGRIKSDYKLRIDSNGYLYFKILNNPEYTYFAVKAAVDPNTTIRPGDDFLLRFTIASAEYTGPAGIATEGSFLAVYDKKLVWRAQLYIDETLNADGTASGNTDWNDENPWITGNDWNKDWDDEDGDGITDEQGDGGQFRLKPWTSIYTHFPIHEAWAITRGYPLEVYNAVAYSMGCDDTPYFFNLDMEEQKNALRAYYNPNNNTLVAPNPAPGTHRDWATWTDTLPPLGEWENYIRANPANQNTAYFVTGVGGTIFYPYTPGFSSYRVLNGDTPGYFFDHTQYSAGTECQGLITRAAGYAGNTYTADSPDETIRTLWNLTTGQGIIGPSNWTTVGWVINDIQDIDTSLLIPGDVIMINGHVGLVYKINYDQDRIAAINAVNIIEAYGGTMAIHNRRTWEDFANASTTTFCNLLRLCTQ